MKKLTLGVVLLLCLSLFAESTIMHVLEVNAINELTTYTLDGNNISYDKLTCFVNRDALKMSEKEKHEYHIFFVNGMTSASLYSVLNIINSNENHASTIFIKVTNDNEIKWIKLMPVESTLQILTQNEVEDEYKGLEAPPPSVDSKPMPWASSVSRETILTPGGD